MPRRKKYPKLPNGYGSIKKLSGKRRNPFGVYPPATEMIAPGQYAPVKAICYVDDYMKGFAVLTAWHAGAYYPGFERTLNDFAQRRTVNSAMDNILMDYLQGARLIITKKRRPRLQRSMKDFIRISMRTRRKPIPRQVWIPPERHSGIVLNYMIRLSLTCGITTSRA